MSLCECGCGATTRVSKWNDRAKGYVRGQPLRFIKGHRPKQAGLYGAMNPNWRGGRSVCNGYIMVRMPDGSRKYEHILVAEKALGRPLKWYAKGDSRNEVVHHIDSNKKNNAPSNLLLCTHGYHIALHARLEASPAWPEFAPSERLVRAREASLSAWADPVKRAERVAKIAEATKRRYVKAD